MTDAITFAAAAELLTWYREAGVDCAVSEAPVNWLERGQAAPGHGFKIEDRLNESVTLAPLPPTPPRPSRASPALPHAGSTQRPQTPLAPSEAETDARSIARGVRSLIELEAALQTFNGCALKATATNTCVYRGAGQARLMIIGEAPGRDEDLEGKPFVGRAGKMLDKMLGAIGLGEDDVHIANVVYWRPPGNRTPTAQETLACRPFLDRQIELVSPEIILVAGGTAAKEFFNLQEGIMRLRGRWRDVMVAGRTVAAIATLHPAYLLRTPAAKHLAWQDMLAVRAKLSPAS